MLKAHRSVLALAGVLVCSAATAVTVQEDFSTNPLQNGWQVFGDADLFRWDSTNQNLAVTWDSSQTNSYFYHPLGTILTTNDAFSLEFDLTLADVSVDNGGSELGIGFLRQRDAFDPGFLRTFGTSPNVGEFDYFPPAAYPASTGATLIDSSNGFYFSWSTAALEPGTRYHVRLEHVAGEQGLDFQVFTNGQLYTTAMPGDVYGAISADLRLDVLAISSYQDDGFGDTLLAHGTVDNVVITVPPPPVQGFSGALTNAAWQGQFSSQTNWLYTLERTVDFQSWTPVSGAVAGTAGLLTIQDTNAPANGAFYRVRAERP